jgi:hypothetical protein
VQQGLGAATIGAGREVESSSYVRRGNGDGAVRARTG